jgi:hypothetical protein
MGFLDGILGGVVGAEALSLVKGYFEKHGGIEGVVSAAILAAVRQKLHLSPDQIRRASSLTHSSTSFFTWSLAWP